MEHNLMVIISASSLAHLGWHFLDEAPTITDVASAEWGSSIALPLLGCRVSATIELSMVHRVCLLRSTLALPHTSGAASHQTCYLPYALLLWWSPVPGTRWRALPPV